MKSDSNKIKIYINLKIPKSKKYIFDLINYVKDELTIRYINAEDELRKYLLDNEIGGKTTNYYKLINIL